MTKPKICNASKRRVFLAAASVLSPGASNLKEFLDVVQKGKSVLTPKASLSNLFLAGIPKFNFENYKSWINSRHDPKRFVALNEKSGELVKFTLGTCIDALNTNAALESVMQKVDPRVAIFISTGLGDISSQFQATKTFDAAMQKWNDFWASKPSELKKYLKELTAIETLPVQGEDIENAKLSLIRLKMKTRRELAERYGFPTPPWESVSPHLIWNIPNLPAAQISMLLGLHGVAVGTSAACASFGVALDQAMNELESCRSDIAIVGASDITPTDELISAFYAGRLAVAGQKPGIPFCDLRGTHISGGACIWVLATEDIIQKHNLKHFGVEILSVGVSSDAEHIITPSKQGPKLAIQRAFEKANITPKQIDMWDMHATGTPGDWNEFQLIKDFVPKEAFISARKGIFGHGMAASGAWELTAQLLGCRRIEKSTFEIAPTGIPKALVNPKIASLKRKIVYTKSKRVKFKTNSPICGKLSMGVGGISSCVIARLAHTSN